MKKIIPALALLLTSSVAASAFADPPPYVRYKIDISVDGKVIYRDLPVNAPQKATVALAASSPRDDEEAFVKLSLKESQQGFEVAGHFVVKEEGSVVSDTPFTDVIVPSQQGYYHFDYNGKTYEFAVRPM